MCGPVSRIGRYFISLNCDCISEPNSYLYYPRFKIGVKDHIVSHQLEELTGKYMYVCNNVCMYVCIWPILTKRRQKVILAS